LVTKGGHYHEPTQSRTPRRTRNFRPRMWDTGLPHASSAGRRPGRPNRYGSPLEGSPEQQTESGLGGGRLPAPSPTSPTSPTSPPVPAGEPRSGAACVVGKPRSTQHVTQPDAERQWAGARWPNSAGRGLRVGEPSPSASLRLVGISGPPPRHSHGSLVVTPRVQRATLWGLNRRGFCCRAPRFSAES